MKKLLFLFFFFLLTVPGSITVNANPGKTLSVEMNLTKDLNAAMHALDNNFYKTALNKFELAERIDAAYYLFNKQNFEHLFSEYKKQLLSESTLFEKENENIFAANLLNSKLKFYEKDHSVLSALQYNLNKLQESSLVKFSGNVPVLALGPLLKSPENATPENAKNYLTASEFNKIFFSLYNNNYVLVSLKDIKTELRLPAYKKPILLLFEDSLTTQKEEGRKLVLDKNKHVAAFLKNKPVRNRVSLTADPIPLLEAFIKQHPEFSHNSARGCILLNAENNVFGYPVFHGAIRNEAEIKKALRVANHLKTLGWEIASLQEDERLEPFYSGKTQALLLAEPALLKNKILLNGQVLKQNKLARLNLGAELYDNITRPRDE